MNVVVTITRSEDMMYESLEIDVNGKAKFHVSSSEDAPEDNSLSRGFSDCYDIPKLLKMAHQAGLNGEDLNIQWLEEGMDDY
jgi:hypothetical protein